MNLRTASRLAAAAGVIAIASTGARAVMYGWNYTKGEPASGSTFVLGPTARPGGTIESIAATFDTATKRLTFDTIFSGTTANPANPITSGFWLVLDNGPVPQRHAGELAILYFDAATLASPKLTVYGYNGEHSNNSWLDGAADTLGDQSPDLIKGIYEAGSFVNSLVAETITIGGIRYRHLKFDINAADIIGRTPRYPETGPWRGTGFDTHLGIWFHPVDELNATYQAAGAGRRGKITSLAPTADSYLDASDFTTFIIPSPASGVLLGLGGLAGLRRRRA